MAILAPKIPQYRSKRSLSNTGVPFSSLATATLEGGAYSNLGRVVEAWGDKIKRQRDAAVVGDIYNSWRDQDRAKLSELLQRKGRNAVNLGQDYNEFFDKSFANADKQAENGSQQAAVRDYLSRRREQSLDILSRYEAQEAHRYRKEQEQGVINNAISDARESGYNEPRLYETIQSTFDHIEKSNIGIAPEAMVAIKRKVRQEILFANMQSRISIDPDIALKDIEAMKGDLGEGYETLKNAAEAKSQERLVENLRDELNRKHSDGVTPDFNAMEDDIQKANIPDEIKDQVIVWIRSQESEFDRREKEKKDKAVDADMDDIFNKIRGGRYPDAFQAVLRSQSLTETQKFRIEELIKSQQTESYKSDGQTFINIAKKAMRGDATRDEIINLIGNGLNVKDGEDLLGELKKATDPDRKELSDKIKKAADSIEKQLLKGSVFSGYTSDSVEDAYQGYKDLMRELSNPPENVTVEQMLDPESEHYIVENIVLNHLPTPEESLQRQVIDRSQRTRSKMIFRKPDETIEEYYKRTGQ